MMSLRNIILGYFCILLYSFHVAQGLPYQEMEEIFDNEFWQRQGSNLQHFKPVLLKYDPFVYWVSMALLLIQNKKILCYLVIS